MTKPASPFGALVLQLLEASSAGQSHGAIAWPPNPFPRGVRSGSGSAKVLAALQEAHPRWLEHCDLMQMTGCSRGMADWAIRYLTLHGMVRAVPSYRNPQYLRYQATNKDYVQERT